MRAIQMGHGCEIVRRLIPKSRICDSGQIFNESNLYLFEKENVRALYQKE